MFPVHYLCNQVQGIKSFFPTPTPWEEMKVSSREHNLHAECPGENAGNPGELWLVIIDNMTLSGVRFLTAAGPESSVVPLHSPHLQNKKS